MPRQAFVPETQRASAYDDRALSIGHGQTISQPYMVALMTEELRVGSTHRVLEIGTGSGYQAAILAELAAKVYTVERIRELSLHAAHTLARLGYTNVYFRVGDGTLGWPDQAPFDRIIVTAGGPKIPQTLVEQLIVGGIMVIPVGSEYHQTLTIVTRTKNGFETHEVCGCVFVKLKGREGW